MEHVSTRDYGSPRIFKNRNFIRLLVDKNEIRTYLSRPLCRHIDRIASMENNSIGVYGFPLTRFSAMTFNLLLFTV